MRRDAIDFLERLIRDYGLLRLFVPLSTIGAIAVGAGLISDASTLSLWAAVGLFCVLLVTIVAQGMDRRALYQERSQMKKVMHRYVEHIRVKQQSRDYFTISDWDESVSIDKEGTAHIERKLTLRAGNEPISAFWHATSQESQPSNRKFRDRVSIRARRVEGDNSMGVELITTHAWNESNVWIYVHLHEPVSAGHTFTVHLEIQWPNYFEALVRGEPESNHWMFRRYVGSFKSEVRIDKSLLKGRHLRVSPYESSMTPARQSNPDGSQEILLSLEEPKSDLKFGYYFQLEVSILG